MTTKTLIMGILSRLYARGYISEEDSKPDFSDDTISRCSLSFLYLPNKRGIYFSDINKILSETDTLADCFNVIKFFGSDAEHFELNSKNPYIKDYSRLEEQAHKVYTIMKKYLSSYEDMWRGPDFPYFKVDNEDAGKGDATWEELIIHENRFVVYYNYGGFLRNNVALPVISKITAYDIDKATEGLIKFLNDFPELERKALNQLYRKALSEGIDIIKKRLL